MQAAPKPEWDRILSYAQKNNAAEIHRLVTQEQVSPNHANSVGQSALHVASIWGHSECVMILLELGADPDVQNSIMGSTPLHSCISFPPDDKKPWRNKVACMKLLVEKGANVHLKDLQDNTPADIMESLLDKEKIQEPEYITAVNDILQNGMNETLYVIPFLQDELENTNQETIKSVSDRFKHHLTSVVQQSGGNLKAVIDERDSKTLRTPLLFCIDELLIAFEEEKEFPPDLPCLWTDLIQELIALGADTNVTAQKKLEPETYREETHRPITRVCRSLMEAHANKSKYANFLERVALLLKENNAELTKAMKDVMHDASRRGNTPVCKFYVEKLGFDPNTKGRQGMTPLHFSARSGKTEIVRWLLLEYSGNIAVDPSIGDDRGKTAYDFAVANKKQDIMEMLSPANP